MEKLREIVEGESTKAGRVFDLVIQTLIVVSLVSFAIETLPDLSSATRRALQIIEVVTVAVFTVEYFLRILVSRHRWRYIFSFNGVVDLLAILPFYVAKDIDLRSIRVFRLFRLVRVFRIPKLNQAVQRMHRAFASIKHDLMVFGVATVFVLYLAGVGIYYFENPAQPEEFKSIFHSLWWAVTTLTTVGYGDIYPITAGGKLFTFVVLIVGMGVIAVPTGLISSALSATMVKKETDQDLDQDLDQDGNKARTSE